MEQLIDYSMYDEATNGFFTVKVTAARAGELNNDGLKTARLITALKMQGHVPVSAGVRQGTDQGAIPKKKGKSFRWSQSQTEDLLKLCFEIRYTLRKKKVPLAEYEKIAMKLSLSLPEPVTGVQCRERVRWLKSHFDEVKKEKEDKDWEYGTIMRFIFDAPLEEVPPWLLGSQERIQTFGSTYVVSSPKYVFGGLASPSFGASDSEIIAQAITPQAHPYSVHPIMGRTYSVQDPKYVTGPFGNGTPRAPSKLLEVPESDVLDNVEPLETPEVPEFIDPNSANPFGLTYTVENPKYALGPLGNRTFISPNEAERHIILETCDAQHDSDEPILFATGNLNTTSLQSSTLPSETFFVRNVNLNSTPENENNEDVIRSPARKKPVHREAAIRTPETPRSTPRRKKRYQTETWLPGITHALLKECLKRKEELLKGNPKSSLWKEVTEDLVKLGFKCEWQACREKFESMNMFFERSLLKVNGFIGKTRWPYYGSFLEFHDLPPNYIQPEAEPVIDNYYENEEEDPKLWPDNVIELLISLYKERRHLFKSSKSCVRHSTLYQEIAGIMKIFDHDRNQHQCQRKIKSMLSRFRTEADLEKGTGRPPSTWPWFDTMMDMEKGAPNLNAPSVCSVGAVTEYSLQGEQQSVVEKRNTRTRTTANSNTTSNDEEVDNPQGPKQNGAKGKKKEVPKKQLYKSWAQQVQEKSAEAQQKAAQAKSEMVEEVRLLRISQAQYNAPKNEAFKNIAEAMRDISAFCRSFNSK